MRAPASFIKQPEITTGYPRAIASDSGSRNSKKSLLSIANRAFEAGRKLCEPSSNIYEINLAEISEKTWRTVFSRIGLVISEVASSNNYESHHILAFQNVASVSAIELGLNSQNTATALKLFWSICEYANFSTVADNTICLNLDFLYSASYFKQLESLDVRTEPRCPKPRTGLFIYPERVYESAVIIDGHLAGVESQLGFTLRHWFYNHQENPSEIKRQQQQIALHNFNINIHPELKRPGKIEYCKNTVIAELLPAAGIEQEKRQLVADFILKLPKNDLAKADSMILSFASDQVLNNASLRACYLMYCYGRNNFADLSQISLRSIRKLNSPQSEKAKNISLVHRQPDLMKLESSEKKTQIVAGLIKRADITSEVLFFALCSLGLEKNTLKGYLDFGQRIIKIKDSAQSSSRSSPLETIKTLIDLAAGQPTKIEYDQLFKHRFTDLLKQLCYRHYSGDVTMILKELERCHKIAEAKADSISEQIVSKLLKDIIPGLLQLFRQIAAYKTPQSIKVSLLKEQKEGVVAAINFEKLLLLYGTGTGKTEVGAAYCESLGIGKVLWATKAGNVYDTASRLRTKILVDRSAKILALDSSCKALEAQELRALLARNHYVVAGYDYLRHLRTSNPESFAILQQWISSGIRVLDEAHVLDNPESARSRTMQELKSEKIICLSATPFQHRPERIATIFHLCFTEKYPDPQVLIRHLRKNKALIKDLIDQHSTIYNIQDLGKHFEDSDQLSLAEQITADTPRMPRLRIERKKYMLSDQHTELYVKLATDYKDYAIQNGYNQNAVCQVAILQRLIQDPESLGSGAPFALLSAVKEVALPLLDKGEKIIFFGYRPKTLEMLVNDPELKKYGIALITGRQNARLRTSELHRLEEDPKLLCAAIQPVAAGSGHNCRSVGHIIAIDSDRRLLIADRIQALGRPVRLLFPGDERFARMEVKVTILEPELQPSIFNKLKDSKYKKILQNGTIYSQWLDRDQAALEEFYYYTARGQKTLRVPAPPSIESLVSSLSQRIDSIEEKHMPKIFSGTPNSPVNLYNNDIKNAWRELGLKEFLKAEIKELGKDPSELRVAHFAGAEALEIPCYLELGILPKNILGFGLGTAAEREYCKANVLRHGAQFIASRAQDILPYSDINFDIVSIDPEGYLTNSLASTILQLRLSENAIVIKNTLQARETRKEIDLIRAASGSRSNLDAILVKLCATNPANAENVADAIRYARQVSRLSRQIAGALSEKTEFEKQSLADLIAEAYLGTWHTKSFSQLRYNSDGGSPFLSTFFRLKQWQKDIINQHVLRDLKSFMHSILEKNSISACHSASQNPSVIAHSNMIILRHKTVGIVNLNLSDLKAVLAYYRESVEEKYSLKGLLNFNIPHLKLVA